MYRLVECITQEHVYSLLAVAALVCVAGSCLTVMTLRRLAAAPRPRKRIQLALSCLITGTTIWATHFIAMLAYDPGVPHGYEPFFTGISLVVAILGTLGANALLAYGKGRRQFLFAGVGFGLTVSMMHFVGMSALQIPGTVVWHFGSIATAVVLGAMIGIASYHRIVFPVTRYCWLGGAALMVLTIITMHFTAMSAFEIRLDSSIDVPPQILSNSVLSMLIFAVVTFILLIGFSALSIETNIEREAVAQLEHTAIHDYLTGLPNRLQLKRRFEELSWEFAMDPRAKVAVLSIDLDLFKQVNDIHGHEIGDLVLIEVANRIRAEIGEAEFVARIGGDEFVAIKTQIKCDEDAVEFAERIASRIAPTIYVADCAVMTGVSVGVATSIADGTDLDDLLRKSDLAMFRAKQDLDQQTCLYDANMDQQVRDKMLLTADLRKALAGDEFEIVYQIQNDAGSRRAIGCEVLLRWHHPQRGLISPTEFIPLAEETGLIQEIGLWVLRNACMEAATWTNPLSVAVNVAPQQFAQTTFLDHLATILNESKLPPERLELEVTEASIIHDQAAALKTLNKIKDMGIGIAMDDFGTGYSSLATLQTFPFDKIKIDRSFISGLHLNHQSAAIVRSTLSLGQALGIPVLAEGVETEDELLFLSAEGCDLVQGFYFGKPLCVAGIRDITVPDAVDIAS